MSVDEVQLVLKYPISVKSCIMIKRFICSPMYPIFVQGSRSAMRLYNGSAV